MRRRVTQFAVAVGPSGCTVASGVVGVVIVVVVVVGGVETHKRNFYRSEFKVTRDISPTISGWLLVLTDCNHGVLGCSLTATRFR